MTLSVGERTFEFRHVQLEYGAVGSLELFAKKNNRTVRQTLLHPKYSHLAQDVSRYDGALEERLGDFLLRLKRANDPFYTRFLNRYGDDVYCEFRIVDPGILKRKGLYCFTVGGALKYIGKSSDSFRKRINQGYGRIHPKNCYRDGQATNCHLNALIAGSVEGVELHVCPMEDDQEITATEAALIAHENPEWNIQLKE